MELLVLADAFGRWALLSGAAPGTVSRYARAIRALARNGIVTVADVCRAKLIAFQDARQMAGIATRSINGDVAGLVTLLRWLVKRGEVGRAVLDEAVDIWLPVPRPKLADCYSLAEYETICSLTSGWFRLAFKTACLTGLRLSELRHLEWRDLELGAKPMLRVRVTKGGRERLVPLCQEAAAFLRVEREEKTAGPVFPSMERFNTISAYRNKDSFQRGMLALSKRTGWRCTFHKCRRTFCTWALRSGRITPPEVASIMGHCDLTMIMRCYYVFLVTWNPGIEGLMDGGRVA